MTFTLQLAAFAEKAKGNAEKVLRRTLIDVSTEVLDKTPVGNPTIWKHRAPPGYVGGRLRNNWFLQEARITAVRPLGPDRTGEAAKARILAALEVKVGGKIWFLFNNLPYARAIEYGHSTQAPAGMVGTTVIHWQTFVDKAVADAKTAGGA